MNIFLLMQALRAALAKDLAALPLPAPAGASPAWRVPEVFVGSLPPVAAEGASQAPYVLIRALKGHEREGQQHVEVRLCVAVRGEDRETVENDLHNLLARVRQTVLREGGAALNGKYRLTSDSEGRLAPWARLDGQDALWAEAGIITNWSMKGME